MAIEIIDISEEMANHIVGHEEGHFLDVKAIDISPASLTKTMSAFANSDGGELYIGIDEDRQTKARAWRGFGTVEDANGHLQAFEEFFPLGGDFKYEFLSTGDETGLVLHVTILKSAAIKNASNGTPYVRRGAQNLRVTDPERLDLLRRTKGIISFESEAVGTAAAEEITNSEAVIGFMLDVIPEGEPEAWLVSSA